MKTREKIAVFVTFLGSCLAIALLAASLGSQFWVVATVTRPSNPKSEGRVNFGLFRGVRRLNHGFGERVYDMNVIDVTYRERSFMIHELYVCTIACVCAAMLFGIISACLALYNAAGNPVEAVCHLPGLFSMNVIGFLLSLIAVITWLVQFFVKLRSNVLVREDIASGGWDSMGQATVGYSFWLTLIASLLFFVNSVVVQIIQRRRYRRNSARSPIITEGKPNGNLMLY